MIVVWQNWRYDGKSYGTLTHVWYKVVSDVKMSEKTFVVSQKPVMKHKHSMCRKLAAEKQQGQMTSSSWHRHCLLYWLNAIFCFITSQTRLAKSIRIRNRPPTSPDIIIKIYSQRWETKIKLKYRILAKDQITFTAAMMRLLESNVEFENRCDSTEASYET